MKILPFIPKSPKSTINKNQTNLDQNKVEKKLANKEQKAFNIKVYNDLKKEIFQTKTKSELSEIIRNKTSKEMVSLPLKLANQLNVDIIAHTKQLKTLKGLMNLLGHCNHGLNRCIQLREQIKIAPIADNLKSDILADLTIIENKFTDHENELPDRAYAILNKTNEGVSVGDDEFGIAKYQEQKSINRYVKTFNEEHQKNLRKELNIIENKRSNKQIENKESTIPEENNEEV